MDSSRNMGLGHVMRCLALADQLKCHCFEICFICRNLPGNIITVIENKYKVYILDAGKAEFELQQDWLVDAEDTKKIIIEKGLSPDWLILDHYAFDAKWERYLFSYTKRLMVIDDIADRQHDCHILIDQNLFDNLNLRYLGLVSEDCLKLLGPSYALLRPEFKNLKKKLQQKNGRLNRIFISFGGSDLTNETSKALSAIRHLSNSNTIVVDVVIGKANLHYHEIQSMCTNNIKLHVQTKFIAQLMAKADLAIGAGGISNWERCCLGLPSLVSIVADNQYETVTCLEKHKVVVNMGRAEVLTDLDYLRGLNNLTTETLEQLSKNAYNLVDGCGCERAVQKMIRETQKGL